MQQGEGNYKFRFGSAMVLFKPGYVFACSLGLLLSPRKVLNMIEDVC